MRIWQETTLATSYPLVTNSLGKTVKVPTRCALAVKHQNTLSGMPYSAHPHTVQVVTCSHGHTVLAAIVVAANMANPTSCGSLITPAAPQVQTQVACHRAHLVGYHAL